MLEKLIDEIERQYELQFDGKRNFLSDKLGIIAAKENEVVFVDFPSMSISSRIKSQAKNYCVSCADKKIILGSANGLLALENGEIREKDSHPVWHIKNAEIDSQQYVFACCADNRIRVYNNDFKLEQVFKCNKPPLCLDIYNNEIVFGMQLGNNLCCFNLYNLLAGKDESKNKIKILKGPKAPVKAVIANKEIFAGSFDGNVYVYQDYKLKNTIKVGSPVYSLSRTSYLGEEILLIGNADGKIICYSDCKHVKTYETDKKVPVKALHGVKIGSERGFFCSVGEHLVFANIENDETHKISLESSIVDVALSAA